MTNPQGRLTCADKVASARDSRLFDIRTMFHGVQPDDMELRDDGTLDTVLVDPLGNEYRYDSEFAAEFREKHYRVWFKDGSKPKLFDDREMETMAERFRFECSALLIDGEVNFDDDSGGVVTEYGEIDLDLMLEGHEIDGINESLRQQYDEYFLAFDYVRCDGDEPSYFRLQISFGGPSEEIRVYCDPDYQIYKAEFWYLDWFDGANLTLHGLDLDLIRDIWAELVECEAPQYAIDSAC